MREIVDTALLPLRVVHDGMALILAAGAVVLAVFWAFRRRKAVGGNR